MPLIYFDAKLSKIGIRTILQLPASVSAKLPSRGQVMVKGKINNFNFIDALEPDGKGGHWLNVDKTMQQAISAKPGDTVKLAIESTKDWPEPNIPADWQAALSANPSIRMLWQDITPMARWEWIRWIGSTAQTETRKRRVEVSMSKLKAGGRRPCCFNRNMCCVPDVSKNGVLLDAA